MSLLNKVFKGDENHPVLNKLDELVKEIRVQEVASNVAIAQLEQKVISLEKELLLESFKNFSDFSKLKKSWIKAKVEQIKLYITDGVRFEDMLTPYESDNSYRCYQEHIASFIQENLNHLSEEDVDYVISAADLVGVVDPAEAAMGIFSPEPFH